MPVAWGIQRGQQEPCGGRATTHHDVSRMRKYMPPLELRRAVAVDVGVDIGWHRGWRWRGAALFGDCDGQLDLGGGALGEPAPNESGVSCMKKGAPWPSGRREGGSEVERMGKEEEDMVVGGEMRWPMTWGVRRDTRETGNDPRPADVYLLFINAADISQARCSRSGYDSRLSGSKLERLVWALLRYPNEPRQFRAVRREYSIHFLKEMALIDLVRGRAVARVRRTTFEVIARRFQAPTEHQVAFDDRYLGGRGNYEKLTTTTFQRMYRIQTASRNLHLSLSHSLSRWRSHSKTLSKLRVNDYISILERVTRAEARHASYQKEISRLKRILAACPPPGQRSSARASTQKPRNFARNFAGSKHTAVSHPPSAARIAANGVFVRRPRQISTTVSDPINHKRHPLAHVCSYWRTVALDTSRLWTTIFIPPHHQSSIALLEFYSSHAKTSPLTVHFHRSLARPILRKLLAHMSHRWHDVYLTVENSAFGALEVVRRKVPLLKSLSIYNESERDGTQTNDVFESAPALRRVVLTTASGTAPTLYFCAFILPRPGEAAQQLATAEPHHGRGHGTALRKLVVLGAGCQDVLLAHTFPRLRSLSIVLGGPLHPDFPAFLARARHTSRCSPCAAATRARVHRGPPRAAPRGARAAYPAFPRLAHGRGDAAVQYAARRAPR
ncbi:hypothetical protein B0H14DRAFT_2611046, partial [Mycena olivaceomarginata]